LVFVLLLMEFWFNYQILIEIHESLLKIHEGVPRIPPTIPPEEITREDLKRLIFSKE